MWARVCDFLALTRAQLGEGGQEGEENRNLVLWMSNVVEKARRDDSAVRDSCLHVFEWPPGGRGNRFLWGAPETRLPAGGRGRKAGARKELCDHGDGTAARLP